MGKLIIKGWSKPSDEIPQPTSIIMGANLRKNSEKLSKPKKPSTHQKPPMTQGRPPVSQFPMARRGGGQP
jgi:hypothetical protein